MVSEALEVVLTDMWERKCPRKSPETLVEQILIIYPMSKSYVSTLPYRYNFKFMNYVISICINLLYIL